MSQRSSSSSSAKIIHVDGDAFFASCEIAQNERLRGRPVVTGEEKGIAIAVSYEAKARGIMRSMLMREVRKLCPEAIILPGNYDLYKIYAKRMYTIVRKHAPTVEEYSVDECFADISSVANSWTKAVKIAHQIQNDLAADLGMTFSLGLAPTKTLAKVASKIKKPAGFTAIESEDIKNFLKDIPIGKVWGIGPRTSLQLQKNNIRTALDFINCNKSWVESRLEKPYQGIWYELQGISANLVGEGGREKHKSLRCTRTWHPPSKNLNFIFSELSRNAEKACHRLRQYGLRAKSAYFFLKTQSFRYIGEEIKFDEPVSTPSEIMIQIKKTIGKFFDPKIDYRASGVVLHGIVSHEFAQMSLFSGQSAPTTSKSDKNSAIHESLKQVYKRHGKNAIFLTSSLRGNANKNKQEENLSLKSLGLRLGIPSWGYVP